MSLCTKAIADRGRKLLSDAGGNVGIIFAFSLLPILLAVGAAIDYGHYNQVRARIQSALDSTGLMLAHNVGTMPTDDLLDLAEEFFTENFPPQPGVTINKLNTIVDGDNLRIEASASVEMYIMHMAGVQFLSANVDTEIVRAEDSYEVVLVLDNTGSMGGSKIAALKDASELLTNNLFGEETVHPLLDMALVPFSHAVNVGTGNKNASWMDTQARNPLHYENFDEKEMKKQDLTRFDLYDRITNASWPGCVEARAYPLDVDDTAASAGKPDTLFVPYFYPDEPNEYEVKKKGKKGKGGKGGKTTIDNYSFNEYFEDGVDDDETDKVKQENVDKYKGKFTKGKGPKYRCDANPIVPLTNNKKTITDALDDMKADGYTNITEGLMWGFRVISPGAPFTEGKPYTEKNHHKIIILLTDGENRVPNFSNKSDNINKGEYGPWGFAASGRLVDTSSRSVYEAKMNERTAEACDAVKDEDIDLFTITFQLSDSDTINLMRNCATQPDMYYNSPDTSTLSAVFKAIATRISELRISK
jgi:Flp pilus assembly protein TadG